MHRPGDRPDVYPHRDQVQGQDHAEGRLFQQGVARWPERDAGVQLHPRGGYHVRGGSAALPGRLGEGMVVWLAAAGAATVRRATQRITRPVEETAFAGARRRCARPTALSG